MADNGEKKFTGVGSGAPLDFVLSAFEAFAEGQRMDGKHQYAGRDAWVSACLARSFGEPAFSTVINAGFGNFAEPVRDNLRALRAAEAATVRQQGEAAPAFQLRKEAAAHAVAGAEEVAWNEWKRSVKALFQRTYQWTDFIGAIEAVDAKDRDPRALQVAVMAAVSALPDAGRPADFWTFLARRVVQMCPPNISGSVAEHLGAHPVRSGAQFEQLISHADALASTLRTTQQAKDEMGGRKRGAEMRPAAEDQPDKRQRLNARSAMGWTPAGGQPFEGRCHRCNGYGHTGPWCDVIHAMNGKPAYIPAMASMNDERQQPQQQPGQPQYVLWVPQPGGQTMAAMAAATAPTQPQTQAYPSSQQSIPAPGQHGHVPGIPFCSHCQRHGHSLESCWFVHPEKRPASRGRGGWRGRGRGGRGGGGNEERREYLNAMSGMGGGVGLGGGVGMGGGDGVGAKED